MTTFVSLFAGVGGFDLGFEQQGWTCLGQVEIDKHARGVLERQWPDVPKHDDVRTAKEWADGLGLVGRVDVVCGGFPCQDLSVAGKRAGLAGERSGLFWDAVAFAQHVQARWIVLENVPGLLNSNGGADFATVLAALADAGYGYREWRVLDSQFFGVAQRRRRVFVVAGVGAPHRSPVFAEPEGRIWNLASHDEARKDAAGTVAECVETAGQLAQVGGWHNGRTTAVCSKWSKGSSGPAGDEHHNLVVGVLGTRAHTLTSEGFDAGEDGTGRGTPIIAFSHTQGLDAQPSTESFPTLRTEGGGHAVMVRQMDVFPHRVGTLTQSWSNKNYDGYQQVSQGSVPVVNGTVRRLTPTEVERLQGFPDGWTAGQADSHRYRQMGNAVTVNVANFVAWCFNHNAGGGS